MSALFSPGLFTKLGALIGLIGGILTSSGDLTYGPAITGIGIFIGNWASRQNNVTSEQAGIKAPEVVIAVVPQTEIPPITIVVEKKIDEGIR